MKTIICMTTLILSITSCSEKQAGNPLLEHFTTPHQTPPFDRIETRHYEPAFDQAIEEAKQEIKAISTSAEAPDFENTIVALDQAGEKLSTISSIFFNLTPPVPTKRCNRSPNGFRRNSLNTETVYT